MNELCTLSLVYLPYLSGSNAHMAIREDMVKRAVGFLRHPKVTGATQQRQIRFLEDKNLTSEEIDEALKRAAKIGTAEASAKARAALASAPTRRLRKGPIRSEAVVSGGLVYISQQTAMPPSAAGRGTEGYKSGDAASAERLNLNAEQQATKALKNVGSLLEEAGSSPSKVVSAMLCVRDIGQDLEGVEKAWGRWIDGDNPPARTVVQTGAFFAAGGNDSGVCVSVSVTAHL